MKYKFYTLDVFTSQPFRGNQLAVFPQGEGLSEEMMQNIAREFNFSETVFVFPPTNASADYQLRIFTPGGEIPFAGHPTIGTGFLLAKLNIHSPKGEKLTLILQEQVGNVPVSVYHSEGIFTSAELQSPNAPQFFDDIPPSKDLVSLLSLTEEDLHPHYLPLAVSCGLPFLLIPLNSLSALTQAKINLDLWQKTLQNYIAPHVYPCYPLDEFHWRVRMFAPALNIPEDPATGSAATAFSAYLARYQPQSNGTWQWFIEQGLEISRPSEISAIATKINDDITEIKVKGKCVIVTEGILDLHLL